MAETAARRLEIALDLAALATEMFAIKVRREHPHFSDAEVDRAVAEWQSDRPGAEFGDGDGHPVPWPRRAPPP